MPTYHPPGVPEKCPNCSHTTRAIPRTPGLCGMCLYDLVKAPPVAAPQRDISATAKTQRGARHY